jgi:hypothetical protein
LLSAALRSWLDERAEIQWISSVLTEIESFRALARYAPEAVSRLPAVLDQIDLIDLDQRIRMLAQTVTPTTLRSLEPPAGRSRRRRGAGWAQGPVLHRRRTRRDPLPRPGRQLRRPH